MGSNCRQAAAAPVLTPAVRALAAGVDVSETQVKANQVQWEQAKRLNAQLRGVSYEPTWLLGDGENIAALVRAALSAKGFPPHTPADFIMSCPPCACAGLELSKSPPPPTSTQPI